MGAHRHDPVERLNEHHADDLLAVARAFGGHPEATSARAQAVDGDGIQLAVETSAGPVTERIAFGEPGAVGQRLAFRRLVRRARGG